jgi:two-component system CheB/CheR fusion protein
MVALFLQHAGYETVMAYSAQDALEEARDARFDIVLSDIGMPGMNGYELARELRSLPDYSNVPLIAILSFSVFNDRGRALQSGFNAHMNKPINPIALIELVERLVDIDAAIGETEAETRNDVGSDTLPNNSDGPTTF